MKDADLKAIRIIEELKEQVLELQIELADIAEILGSEANCDLTRLPPSAVVWLDAHEKRCNPPQPLRRVLPEKAINIGE